MSDRPMTVEERAARQDEIRARLSEIDNQYTGAALPDQARTEWKSLQEELIVHDDAIRDATERATYLQTIAARNPDATAPGADPGSGYAGAQEQERTGYAPPPGRSRSGNGYSGVRPPGGQWGPYVSRRPHNLYDLTEVRRTAHSLDDLPSLYRDRAKWSIEESTFPGDPRPREVVQERVQHLVETRDDGNGTLARHLLLTGSPEYRRAFGKLLSRLNPAALDMAEQRALQLGSPAAWHPGSYPVPYQLDPTVVLTTNGAINALRQISRVEQIVGKEWLGVTSSGIKVTRANELDTATDAVGSDDTGFMSQPGVSPTRVQAFVPFSVEVEQDWNGLMAEIAAMLADAKDIEEASSFLTGPGTGNMPQGVITGIAGANQTVATAGTGAVAANDVYALESAMAPRFRAQAAFLSSKAGYNAIRAVFQQYASAAGDVWVRPSAGTAAELLGYPAYENSNMAGVATSSVPLVMGDFKQFLIVDRIGMSVELIPHVFGTGGLPQGERGIYALWRNSSLVLVPNAFRYLSVT